MKIILSILCSVTLVTSWGQQWCGTDLVLAKQQQANPLLKEMLHESRVQLAQGPSSQNKKGINITIPVVVHIIHDNGVGNISDAQIHDALAVLNIDYKRQNADTVDTRQTALAPFKDVADGMSVDFVLANIDPQGNCTDGIVRVNAPHLTHDANDDCKYSALGGSDAWPVNRYFNIWIVNSIDSEGAQGIIAGYAYYPDFGPADFYGILMDDDYFGTIGTAANSGSDGRVLTHEMGHALGLPHIFDDGCQTGNCYTEGDYACDTPPQFEPSFNCAPTWNSCTNVPLNDAFGFDAYDNIENYMSYNSCQNMFSGDQVARMEESCNTIPFLMEMTSDTNLVATGVFLPTVFCTAKFDAFNRVLCTGSEVQFYDYSFVNPTEWNWSISPGVEGVDFVYTNGTTPTSQEPTVQFFTSGFYDVSLSASDGTVTDVETKLGFIQVLPLHPSLPFYEGFESYNNLGTTENWFTTATLGGSYPEFEIENGAGHSGSQSVKLTNYGTSGAYTSELLAAQVDLSVVDPITENITLSFRYAYRKRNQNNDEYLKVMVSSNCGENWAPRKTLHGSQLSTISYPAAWTPSSLSDWTTVHMTNITSNYFVENFRYKFSFQGDGGNNFYLDDINIYLGAPSDAIVTTGLYESDGINAFNVYPNPTQNDLTVAFSIATAQHTLVEVISVTGVQLASYGVFANEGSNQVLIDTQALASGVYLVKVTMGDQIRVTPFVVE